MRAWGGYIGGVGAPVAADRHVRFFFLFALPDWLNGYAGELNVSFLPRGTDLFRQDCGGSMDSGAGGCRYTLR